MSISLKTKSTLLLLPLVAVSLLLLANTLNAYTSLRGRLQGLELDAQQAILANHFSASVSRQIAETLDIAFAGEDTEELEAAQLETRTTLAEWQAIVRKDQRAHAADHGAELEVLKRLYAEAEVVLQRFIETARQRGTTQAALLFEQEVQPAVEAALLGAVARLVRMEEDQLSNSMHEVVGGMSPMGYFAHGMAATVSDLDRGCRQAMLASGFSSALHRQIAEYSAIILAHEGREHLIVAREACRSALDEWKTIASAQDTPTRGPDLAEINEFETHHDRLIEIGDEALALAEAGNSLEAWELLEHRLQAVTDDVLMPMTLRQVAEEERQLELGMTRLGTHATRMAFVVAFGALAVLTIGIASPFLVSRKIVRPIIDLTNATEAYGAGRLGTRVRTGTFDEVGRLATNFNEMADKLEDARDTLEQRVRDRTSALADEVNERKAAQASLKQALVTAEAATNAKSQFLANMSHEIRTPLTAMLGYMEQIADGCAHQCEYGSVHMSDHVAIVMRNAEHLNQVIDDILDLSKVEAGKIALEHIACSPCAIAADVASMLRVRAEEQGIALHMESHGAIPATIQTDPMRLRQILVNLTANAIKFTDDGEVRLELTFIDDGDEPRMQFDIVDTGIGMTEEQVSLVFKPFAQADASTTRRFGGTGLGLRISRQLARALGGDVEVADTQVGVGTRFRAIVASGPLDGVPMLDDPMFTTAGPAGPTESAPSEVTSPLAGYRILLAEDGPDNQKLITLILAKAGADVTVVENGKLAVDKALAAMNRRREGDPARPFDCILLDMQMPVMGGYEAASVLRQRAYTGPIIALTAHALSEDRQKCIDAGCDDYATKPINRKKLIEMLRTHLQPAAVPAST